MSGSEGYVNDPPASTTEHSTAETKDSVVALLKALKNLQIDIAAINQAVLAKLSGPGEDSARSGQNTVAVAGTAEALGADVDARDLVIIADPDNAGNIYVGNSSVNNSTGAKLPPGGVLPCGNVNLSAIYIDSDYNLEGISYYYNLR